MCGLDEGRLLLFNLFSIMSRRLESWESCGCGGGGDGFIRLRRFQNRSPYFNLSKASLETSSSQLKQHSKSDNESAIDPRAAVRNPPRLRLHDLDPMRSSLDSVPDHHKRLHLERNSARLTVRLWDLAMERKTLHEPVRSAETIYTWR